MENYYTILGVSESSSSEEIKKKFRQIQLELDSKKEINSQLRNNYQNICSAYNILSNNLLKEQYDKSMNREIVIKDEPVMDTHMNTKAVDMFSVIGEHLLNNVMKNITNVEAHIIPPSISSSHNVTSKNDTLVINDNVTIPPIIQDFYVTYQQAYSGCVLPIEIERKIYIKEQDVSFVTEKETIYINIPKGIDNNEILFFPDKGTIVGQQQGELKVIIKLILHDAYKRDGLDLVYVKNLTLKEALCGTAFNVEHFNKKTFKISTYGHVVTPMHHQSIPELGFQRMDCSPIGDLVIKFHVTFPETLSQDCIEELSNILP